MKGGVIRAKLSVLLGLIVMGTTAHCVELTVEGNWLYVSGRLYNKDRGILEQTLSESPKVTTIVFHNCLGGQLGAANEYVRVISQHRLDTLVSNQSYSACALAFLAGKQRGALDKTGTHMLGLHLSRNKDGTPAPLDENMVLLARIDRLTQGKLGDSVKELLRHSTSETSGVFFVVSNYKIWVRNRAYYCDGTEGRDVSKCQRLSDVDPYTSGIFTTKR